MSIPTLVTFCVYIAGMLAIGFFAWRVTGNLDDKVEVDLDSIELNINQGADYGSAPAFPGLPDAGGEAAPSPNDALMDALRDK